MTVLRNILLLFAGLVAGMADCAAQSPVDEELLGLFEKTDTLSRDHAAPLREAENDISVITAAAFLIYKTFLSSQDNPSCVFTPSCSEYAVEAIRKHGLIVGWLESFDRLSRCHGLVNPEHYPFDTEKRRYYDPVR
jgi:putative membrane protein insertion efficiency factor